MSTTAEFEATRAAMKDAVSDGDHEAVWAMMLAFATSAMDEVLAPIDDEVAGLAASSRESQGPYEREYLMRSISVKTASEKAAAVKNDFLGLSAAIG